MALLAQSLGYPQTNGSLELRTLISAMYPGATASHVQVTNGGSEANCITLMLLVQPGDDVIVMMPNYMQVRASPAGCRPTSCTGTCARIITARRLQARWRPDLDSLARPRHRPHEGHPALQPEQSDRRAG